MALTLRFTSCANRNHDICINNIKFFTQNISTLNSINFNKFIDTILANGTYNNCISSHYNKKYKVVCDFLVMASQTTVIQVQKLIILCQNQIEDEIIKKIIENQVKLNPNYKQELINCANAVRGQYGNIIMFIHCCITFKRLITFKYFVENLEINTFIEMMKQIKDNVNPEFEKIISDYLIINSETIKNYNNILNLINNIINKPVLLKLFLKHIDVEISPNDKLEILNKVVNTQILDVSLILLIMESNDVVPNLITFNNLLSKIYFRTNGAYNSKLIAEIVDIFVLYGFKITKEIIILMLRKGCYVNSIEKYPIQIDESILEICADLSYYPYEFQCIPPPSVVLKECGKENNLEMIKKLKEKGGKINVECLVKACGVKRNGKTIKYIINECNVKPNDKCLTTYQETYGLEALDLLMQNYSNKNEECKNKINNFELDENSTVTIEPKKIVFDNEIQYILKEKIKKFFSYDKKTIKYLELYEIFLKYLINKKLVIGNYFVVNDELHNLTKINQCSLINIDQINNILTCFIDIRK